MARRAPARRTSRRSYKRRPQNVSYHKIITRGSATLNGSDPSTAINLTSLVTSPESSTFYNRDLSTRGNAVVGLRGSWWWWTDATLDSAAIQQQGWLGVGLISMNTDMSAGLDTAPERAAVGPLDLEGRYRPWHYRRTIPIINRYVPAESAEVSFDQAQQVMMSRQGIGARRAEKFLSVRDAYYLYGQVDTNVTFDVSIAWQLQFYIREP